MTTSRRIAKSTHVDKYRDKSAVAQQQRASLDKRYEARQGELNTQRRGNQAMSSGLCDCGLAFWECELVRVSPGPNCTR